MTTAKQQFQEETWESLCDEGRDAAEDMDRGRFRIGDAALKVVKQYGRNRIGVWAIEINVRESSVKEYRTVCRYYPSSVRTDFLDNYPVLCYSHFKEAMRFDDMEVSLAFLEECAENAWTIERALIEIKKRLNKPVPPPKLGDFEGTIKHVDLESGVIVFKIGEGANLIPLSEYIEKDVRLVIHALEVTHADGQKPVSGQLE